MNLVITKEKVFALLILLPYIEGNFLQSILDIYIDNDAYIKAIIFVMAVFMTVLFISSLTYKRTKNRLYILLLGFFIIGTLIYVLLVSNMISTSICVWLWLCVPIAYACSVSLFCRRANLNINCMLKYMLRYFALYVAVVLIYYVAFKGLFFNSEMRMNPRGGGAVIFGYTIAVVFAMSLHLKKSFRKSEYYIILIILTIGALGTKTRASIWPIAVCWIVNFVFNSINKRRIIILAFLLPIIIIIANFDYTTLFSSTSYVGWQRLFNLNSFRRMETINGLLSVENMLPIQQKVFGFGLGNFFPYIRWVSHVDNVANNMFFYKGMSILVQPHNSFLYFLLETGFIGLACIIAVFADLIRRLFKKMEKELFFQIVFFIVLIVVNCVDSIFFVQPGTAGMLWMLSFLVVERHIQVARERVTTI